MHCYDKVDYRRKRRHQRKALESIGTCSETLNDSPERKLKDFDRRNSLQDIDEDDFNAQLEERNKLFMSIDDDDMMIDFKKPELTCISEEGIADMEIADNLLDELEILENITSCNKVNEAKICLQRFVLMTFCLTG